METKGKPILICGVAGGRTDREGGEVAKRLLDRGWPVRILVRAPESPGARALIRLGARVEVGEAGDRALMEKQLADVYGVFCVFRRAHGTAGRDVVREVSVVNAAREAGVAHFIASFAGGSGNGPAGHLGKDAHQGIPVVSESALPTTILRPAPLMERFHIPAMEKALLRGKLFSSLPGGQAFQLIANEDIGAFAALAFEDPDSSIGRDLEIAGDEVTALQAAQIFSRVLRRPVRFRKRPQWLVSLSLGSGVDQIYGWHQGAAGRRADIEKLRIEFPSWRPSSLEGWARSEGWSGKLERYQPHEKSWDVREGADRR